MEIAPDQVVLFAAEDGSAMYVSHKASNPLDAYATWRALELDAAR